MCECEKTKEKVFDEKYNLWYWKYHCCCFNHHVFTLIPGQNITEVKPGNAILAAKPEAGPIIQKVL
jgi:hypothetical protein